MMITIENIKNNTGRLAEEKEAYENMVKTGYVDTDMYYDTLSIFGNQEQKDMYATKYKEAKEREINSGNDGYPESWEESGYTEEEYESFYCRDRDE